MPTPAPSPATPATDQSGPPATAPSGIEVHSINWIPAAERHGTPAHLGALWFVGNINLTAMATGVTALSIGAGLMWTLIATVLGSLFGTFFMAFHSAQGPQLGLPQLVQSRPQFGYLGAALTVWVFALVNYVAYNTSDAILSGDALHTLFGLSESYGYFIAASVAALIALYGYRWIHRVSRWLTWPLVAVMIVVTVAALADGGLPADAFSFGGFKAAAFMTAFVIVAGFQLGWAPYVSDYSRYLPAGVGVRSTFWWTYLPSALSGIWVFAIGAVASAAYPDATPVAAFKQMADNLVGGLGWFMVAALLLGLLSVMAINQYGGMMSIISIWDSFKPVRSTRTIRAVCIAVMFALVWGVAQFVGVDRFNAFYGNVLIFLAYLFTPWTAINLVDYFFVRRGAYSIREIFNPQGIYGRWGWRGNLAYLLAIVAMIPFVVTTPFTGFAASALGGVDYSMFVGLPVAGLLYLMFCRSLDIPAERRIVEEEGVLDLAH
ncbi:purine-cytosine permease family protein [Streptomyces sp. NBC_00829]|uniref:purine-cytosine permease family protein n=1 Tax=Streptomyces sp. NBC_00829 TaxID=2903679 RepID=UPI003864794F|nr:cytosine permease [Streptomyces sp. NBC_00829]